MLPLPNGQIPANARNNVDLPEPDGPVTSTLSPFDTRDVARADQRLALRQPHEQIVDRKQAPPPFAARTSMAGCALAASCAFSTAMLKPSSRAITARHSASCR